MTPPNRAHPARPVRYNATDLQRVTTLLTLLAKGGVAKAVLKATQDAERIETPRKAEARAFLLNGASAPALAAPFVARAAWLRAQGVT